MVRSSIFPDPRPGTVSNSFSVRASGETRVAVVENRLARELLKGLLPAVLFVKQPSRPRAPVFNNSYIEVRQPAREVFAYFLTAKK